MQKTATGPRATKWEGKDKRSTQAQEAGTNGGTDDEGWEARRRGEGGVDVPRTLSKQRLYLPSPA